MKIKRLVKKVSVAATTFALSAVSTFAFADEGSDAITALGTTATAYITAAFGVAVIAAGGFWGISMMKKAFNAGK